jgi:hypothetical protein
MGAYISFWISSDIRDKNTERLEPYNGPEPAKRNREFKFQKGQ